MAGDFVYGLINSIDGERDPRNLDIIFSFMPEFLSTYPLLHLAEEMFEIFACYFPIDFNPSKQDSAAITRDELAMKLTNCLVANNEFAEGTVVLAVEKLESELLVAKLDSIMLLARNVKSQKSDIEITEVSFILAPSCCEVSSLRFGAALRPDLAGSEGGNLSRQRQRGDLEGLSESYVRTPRTGLPCARH